MTTYYRERNLHDRDLVGSLDAESVGEAVEEWQEFWEARKESPPEGSLEVLRFEKKALDPEFWYGDLLTAFDEMLLNNEYADPHGEELEGMDPKDVETAGKLEAALIDFICSRYRVWGHEAVEAILVEDPEEALRKHREPRPGDGFYTS